MVGLSVDPTQTLLVLTSHTSNMITHKTHNIESNGALTLINSTGNYASTVAPIKTVIKDMKIYAYVQGAPDTLHVTDLASGTSTTVTMNVSNYNITITPDRQKALIYHTNNSIANFYTLSPTFPYLGSYDPGISPGYEVLHYPSFSSDSQLVILEYDTFHSTVVLNLNDFSV